MKPYRTNRQSIPKWKRQHIYEEFGGRCMYCGEMLTDYFEVEHLIPVVRGGDNSSYNLGLSCQRCNSLKGTKTVEEFRESLIRDVVTKKNITLFKYLDRRLETYLTEDQLSEIYERLVNLDWYISHTLELKFYFERE